MNNARLRAALKALRMAEPLLRSNRYIAEADACKAVLVWKPKRAKKK